MTKQVAWVLRSHLIRQDANWFWNWFIKDGFGVLSVKFFN